MGSFVTQGWICPKMTWLGSGQRCPARSYCQPFLRKLERCLTLDLLNACSMWAARTVFREFCPKPFLSLFLFWNPEKTGLVFSKSQINAACTQEEGGVCLANITNLPVLLWFKDLSFHILSGFADRTGMKFVRIVKKVLPTALLTFVILSVVSLIQVGHIIVEPICASWNKFILQTPRKGTCDHHTFLMCSILVSENHRAASWMERVESWCWERHVIMGCQTCWWVQSRFPVLTETMPESATSKLALEVCVSRCGSYI